MDPKLPWLSTSIAPTGLTHHWSTTIPLTGVNSTLLQACADHGVMDLSWVSFITASAIDYGDLSLLKNVWSHSTGSKSAPAGDPAFGTVSWFGNGKGKTYQIYVSKNRNEDWNEGEELNVEVWNGRWVKYRKADKYQHSAILLLITYTKLLCEIQVSFHRSASLGACNCPIFLSRRFHRPIYF